MRIYKNKIFLFILVSLLLYGCSCQHTNNSIVQIEKRNDLSVKLEILELKEVNTLSFISDDVRNNIANSIQNELEYPIKLIIVTKGGKEAFVFLDDLEIVDNKNIALKYKMKGVMHFYSLQDSNNKLPTDKEIQNRGDYINIMSFNSGNYSGQINKARLFLMNLNKNWEIINIGK